MSSSKETTVVLFPSLGMGHLIPMVELAKLFINHDFSVTIILVETQHTPSINSTFTSQLSSSHPSISFHRLPVISSSSTPSLLYIQLPHETNPKLSSYLTSLSKTSNVLALILDMFCTPALDVARGLGIPAYFFFTSGASSLSAFVSIPAILSRGSTSFRDQGETPVHFPGLPPIPASHMVVHVLDRDSEACKQFVAHCERLPEADGIMINTFESLEKRAVLALTEGSYPMPPIYCIGPVVAGKNAAEKGEPLHECLAWLDAQPRGSVVYLSFGSRGTFPKEQLKEIAVGLEKCGQRFLWVVRSPPPTDPELTELLPEGFLERTTGRGMVVKSWAPQMAVLEHEAVGGFVSHCGWNSTLEAVSTGVPMIAWPLYAEQKMNKVFLVEEAMLAVEMKGHDKGFVSAKEVEMKVRWLMESKGGRELRDRAMAIKERAKAAQNDGGSSRKAWMDLVNILKKGIKLRPSVDQFLNVGNVS